MPESSRAQRYEGLFQSQTRELFEADAKSAADQDWYPLSETWSGASLFVVYEHDPGRRSRPPARPAAAAARVPAAVTLPTTGHTSPLARAGTAVLMGVAIVAALAVAMVGLQSWDRPGSIVAKPVIVATPAPSRLHAVNDGVWEVPTEVRPGTYRAASADGCYWARLKALTGATRDIIANDIANGPAIVTVDPGDAGFESSRCGKWTPDLRRVTRNRARFGEGTYLVGVDIAPGAYHSSGRGVCSWERLGGFGGTVADILASDIGTGDRVVIIRASDAGFSSRGCGAWTRR